MADPQRTYARPQRTDSRPLAERKHSVAMRKAELRSQLHAVETAEAEIDRLIEEDERAREIAKRPTVQHEGRHAQG